MPCTPPPGGVDEEQINKFDSGVVYGFKRGTGALLWPTGPAVNVPGFACFLALFAFNLWRGRSRLTGAAPQPANR
jgi:hypothetical protein